MSDRTSISAKVIADSMYTGSRLTTFELTFPRFTLAEFNTHRVLSRNSASSRAIPVWKRLVDIMAAPVVPIEFGLNKAGMQSTEKLSEAAASHARHNWLVGRDIALIQAYMLAGGAGGITKDAKGNAQALEVCRKIEKLAFHYRDVRSQMLNLSAGVHKQHTNRVLEPYAWHTVIATGTCWRNFYGLRASIMAQPEIQDLAIAMAIVHRDSVPRRLEAGEWHLPFIFEEDRKEISDPLQLARISSARCARVSYLTHDGKRSLDKDLSMADSLQGNGHESPFEHPARAARVDEYYEDKGLGGNFGPTWIQYRKMLQNERDFTQLITREALLLGMKGDEELVDFVLSLPA